MPTKEQYEELIKYTSNYWINNYDPNKLFHNSEDDGGIRGLNGKVFVGKNENQLFIPAAGYCSGSLLDVVEYVYNLWSLDLSLDDPGCTYYLDCHSDDISINSSYRYIGHNVRPVINL